MMVINFANQDFVIGFCQIALDLFRTPCDILNKHKRTKENQEKIITQK